MVNSSSQISAEDVDVEQAEIGALVKVPARGELPPYLPHRCHAHCRAAALLWFLGGKVAS